MKEKINAELRILAENILKEEKSSSTVQLKEKAKALYEKLTVLAFTEKNLENLAPEAAPSPKEQETSPKKKEPVPVPAESDWDEFAPDGTQYNDADAITEPNTEKIKDIVAQMPPESQHVDRIMNEMNEQPPAKSQQASEKPSSKNDQFHGLEYDKMPEFEPVKQEPAEEKPRSLNDRLKKGITIGLNERLSFIKQLFAGNTSDYNRVLSQLNTFSTYQEADTFIQQVVKPDYKHWEGKENIEKRFMQVIENKFQQ